MSTPKLWAISSSVPRAKLSPLYRLATLLAAIGMVLLPLIYIGIIAALGWWLWDFAQQGPDAASSHRSKTSKGDILFYIVPLIVGGLVILFMIKPLFSRRPKSVEPRRLKREDEPELFAFINEISDLVGSPRPKRVQVDLQVNASAALSHGFGSLFTRNLTLTIGLPLAGGLSAKELGGVLAHEFGHFAQGAGMMTTYMVRVVSFWFARVVYERDRWDATLEEWAKNSDYRIMIVLQISRFFIWLVRRILWGLMMVGQVISSVLMRQMEFDADHYEIQTGGSAGFISTSRRLRILNIGAQIANNRMAESYQSRRLVDNFPGFMTLEAESLTDDIRKEIADAAAKEKTGWLDSHPSDSERIAAAEKAAAPGVLLSEAPGTALFSDYAALSREVTQSFYRDILELPVKDIALLPLEAMAEESSGTKRGEAAMETYFQGVLSPCTMLYLSPDDLLPATPDLVSRNKDARSELDDDAKNRTKELHEALERDNVVRASVALVSAKIPIRNLSELKLESAKIDYLSRQGTESRERLRAREAELGPMLTKLRTRLSTALSYLLSLSETTQELNVEIRRYVSVLRSLQGLDTTLRKMREENAGIGPVLNSMGDSSSQQAVFGVVSSASGDLKPLIERMLTATHEVAYPFPHAGGIVNLAVYLAADVGHPDEIILAFLRSDAILNRTYSVYRRILGRLAILAMEAEKKMDAAESKPGQTAETEEPKISKLEA